MDAREERAALETAHRLVDAGIPVFVAVPVHSKGVWDPTGGADGYHLPRGWQRIEPDHAIVDRWMPGDALCVVLGVAADILDIDPRNGGDLASLNGTMPEVYGVATTPSGGTHHLIAPLGLSKGKLPGHPGIDYLGGRRDGEGRAFAFIAPTVKTSKVTGEEGHYRWTTEPDLDALAADDGSSSEKLRALLEAPRAAQEPRKVAPTTEPPVASERARSYALRALDDELRIVREVPFTEAWNPQVNTSALKVGGYIAPEWGLTYHEARDAFIETLVAGGYSRARAEKATDHGLSDGMNNVHPLSKMGDDPHAALAFDPEEEEAFWTSRPELATIRQLARARLSAPWATLGVVMARAVTATKPVYVLPPLVGQEASLNLFVGLVAGSSGGKGAAHGAARAALPDPMGDVDDNRPLPTWGLGSGEGLVHQYMEFVPARRATKTEEARAAYWHQYQDECLHTVEEVDTLAAVSERNASTLMPAIRSLYMGEEVSFGYAAADKRRKLAEHTYRACLVVGVQPARAEALFGKEADGGTPQRFLWLPATDPDAQDGIPEPPPLEWNRPERIPLTDPRGFHVLPVCDEAVRTTRAIRLARMRGQADDLQGHRNLTRLKVAAALSILNGRMEVSEEDWKLSAYVMRVSDRTLAEVQRVQEQKRKAANVARGKDYADREGVKEEAMAGAAVKRVAGLILKKLSDGETRKLADVRKSINLRDRGYFEDAVAYLDKAVEVGSERPRTIRIVGK